MRYIFTFIEKVTGLAPHSIPLLAPLTLPHPLTCDR